MENILGLDASPALVDKANGVTRWRLNLGIIHCYNIFLVSFNYRETFESRSPRLTGGSMGSSKSCRPDLVSGASPGFEENISGALTLFERVERKKIFQVRGIDLIRLRYAV